MKVKLSKTDSAPAQRAYTLVEVLVAVAVLGIMMATFFAGITGGYAIIDTFRQDLRATQILAQKTEAVRLCTWSQVNSLPSTFTDYYFSLGTSNSTANTTYGGTITVATPTTLPSAYKTWVQLVTIGVSWTNTVGSQQLVHSRQMQTLVAYYGLVNYIYGVNFTNSAPP